MKAGRITVVTRNTPHCYYIYRGQPMGFEYDLAKAFSDDLGVRLKIKIADNWDDMVPKIENGTAAVIAAGIPIAPSRRKQLAFSNGYMDVQQQLIARRDGKKIKRLAVKMKLDPNSWEALAKTLPLLRYRKYCKKAKYDYCRGTEPVSYIKQIMIYYDILKRQGIEYGAVQAKL
jgi:membrane-bound lytic murein transglycosylase MltF